MAYEQVKKRMNTAYEWMLKLEVSGPNVKRLALAEQALEDAFAQLKSLERAKAGLEKEALPEPESEVTPDGKS